MATTARRRTAYPMSYYWDVVKNMDDSQKLELISLLAESVKSSTSSSTEQLLEGYPYKRYTKAELNAMLDEAEANFAAGKGIPDEEAWDDLEEELALQKEEQLEMAEVV